MIIYSKKIIKFINEIKSHVREILTRELALKVFGERFYDKFQRASYPISIVIYNDKRMLGYFDPNFYELGFHEQLMQVNKQQQINIIRHELAHYLVFINEGYSNRVHSPEFRAFCMSVGWGEEVYRATFMLDAHDDVAGEKNGIFRKIQKLMALSSSSNANEAEQAMIKSAAAFAEAQYRIDRSHR